MRLVGVESMANGRASPAHTADPQYTKTNAPTNKQCQQRFNVPPFYTRHYGGLWGGSPNVDLTPKTNIYAVFKNKRSIKMEGSGFDHLISSFLFRIPNQLIQTTLLINLLKKLYKPPFA